MQKKNQKKSENIHKKAKLDWILIACSPTMAPKRGLLMVDCRIKVRLDLQADKTSS
jgi:hypothetical protein